MLQMLKLVTETWSLIAFAVFCFLFAIPPALAGQMSEVGLNSEQLSERAGFPVYTWLPAHEKPKAIILAIHGVTLHGRSYDAFGKEMAKRGYATITADMRGFGARLLPVSANETSGPGYLYKQSLADLVVLLDNIFASSQGAPVFLLGESTGSNVVVALAAQRSDEVAGMVLSSPAVRPIFFLGPTMWQQLKLYLKDRNVQLDLSNYIRSRISEDPRIAEERLNDPLSHNFLTWKELRKTLSFNRLCLRSKRLIPDDIPLLVMHGTADRLYRKERVAKLVARMPSADSKFYMLMDKGHIHLETQFFDAQVIDLVDGWLCQHLPEQVRTSWQPSPESHEMLIEAPDILSQGHFSQSCCQ